LIDIPEHILLEGTKEDLAEWVFPNLEKHYLDAKWMCERAILTPKNNAVNDINDLMMDRFPSIDGEVLAESADKLNDEYEAAGIPNEYLNTLNPPGFPPHHLRLKIRMPLMLLRNLDPSQGLCNGTKLSLKHIYNHTIEVEILGGQHNGKAVCIPRILLKPKEGEYPFDWERCQFPVNVAFAMTINKSQGQTLTRVGIYLPEPVFAHGQLYTGSSRPSHPNNIRVTVIPSVDSQPTNKTRNIVYTEVIEDTT
jgi:ATP-dependent DNA helicase PIF1